MFDRKDDLNILKNGDERKCQQWNSWIAADTTNNVSNEAIINRDNYMYFYNNEGSVDFQEGIINSRRD